MLLSTDFGEKCFRACLVLEQIWPDFSQIPAPVRHWQAQNWTIFFRNKKRRGIFLISFSRAFRIRKKKTVLENLTWCYSFWSEGCPHTPKCLLPPPIFSKKMTIFEQPTTYSEPAHQDASNHVNKFGVGQLWFRGVTPQPGSSYNIK